MDDDPPYGIHIARASGTVAIDEEKLREAVSRTLQSQGCPRARISVALVDDGRMAELNRRFLQHDGPTDVLSFDLSDKPGEGVDGEVVISVETAAGEAAARGHDTLSEVLLYAIHGTLHLLGMDDGTETQAARMHALEDDLLIDMGIGPVYGDAAR